MARQPIAMKRGDLVAVVAPASPMRLAFDRYGVQSDRRRLSTGPQGGLPEIGETELASAISYLESRGLLVRLPSRREVAVSEGDDRYLAGLDGDRVLELNSAFRDPRVRGVICLRGGYGSLRLLSLIDYRALELDPKPVVGFSDITAVLCAIYRRTGIVTFHGPMFASGMTDGADPQSRELAVDALMGVRATNDLWRLSEAVGSHVATFRGGKAEGPLVGGNLSVFCSLLGTPFLPDVRGALLALEEVGEDAYRVDRMLTQLREAGVLAEIGGLVFGTFAGCRGRLDDALDVAVQAARGPCISGICFGHGGRNFTLAIGDAYLLDTRTKTFGGVP